MIATFCKYLIVAVIAIAIIYCICSPVTVNGNMTLWGLFSGMVK